MIQTRSQLIDWIKKNVSDRVLLNAIDRGTVEVLGGFDPLPTSSNPGWMVEVTSAFGQKYLIAVAWDTLNFRLYWFRAPHVSWEDWAGHLCNNSLFEGDNKRLYSQLMTECRNDPRFARIAGCSGLRPETDGGNGQPATGIQLENGDVPPAGAG